MRCEVCGELAAVHVTEVEKGAGRTLRLCGQCALARGAIAATDKSLAPVLDSEGRMQEMRAGRVRAYRACAEFMRREGRSPIGDEAKRMGVIEVSPVEPGSPKAGKYAALFEWVAGVIEAEKRMPRPEEILDWAEGGR